MLRRHENNHAVQHEADITEPGSRKLHWGGAWELLVSDDSAFGARVMANMDKGASKCTNSVARVDTELEGHPRLTLVCTPCANKLC